MTETFGMEAVKPIGEGLVLIQQKEDAVSTANSIIVSNKEGYDGAMGFLKNVKSVMSSVKNYWSEPKTKAHESWKSICAKENAMLEPLTNAEAIVKKKMQGFADEQRRLEQEIQRQQAEARQIESDRLMKEAAEAEKNGDTFQAEINLSMAQSLENKDNFIGNSKQNGTRLKTQLRIINDDLVPRELCSGDKQKIQDYYNYTKKVPAGVILEEVTSIVVR